MDWMTWYNQLAKPGWTPSPHTISTIWMTLYPVIVVSFGFVFYKAGRRQISWRVAVPFTINLIANLSFTPIMFQLRNIPLATADILVVLATIVWAMVAIWRHYRWVAFAQVPYLAWVMTATMLQVSILMMNG